MSKKNIFIAIGLLWVVLLGGFIGYKEFTMKTGQEILLKTIPVDPRDFFRGDYVTLQYDISRIDPSVYPDILTVPIDGFVYVGIKEGVDGYWDIQSVSINAPREGLFIKGKVVSIRGTSVQVEYGIESYFAPANKGYAIQEEMGSRVSAKVKVDSFGNALIETLLIDGDEIDFQKIEERELAI